jgi:hypothetical protein
MYVVRNNDEARDSAVIFRGVHKAGKEEPEKVGGEDIHLDSK